MSRFNVFEYKGSRSNMNPAIDHSVDPAFIEFLILLARTADHLNTQRKGTIRAVLTPEAQVRYHLFSKFCDDRYNYSVMNKGQDIEHHMWSRSLARINVLATLAAILDTPPPSAQGVVTQPSITEAHWEYFERIVMNDINNFKTKQDAGDLGSGDAVRVKKLDNLLTDFTNKPVPETYRVPPDLQRSGKIPYSYIRLRMLQIAVFKTDGNFDDKKLKDCILTLIKMGRLKEIKDPNEKGTIAGDLYWIKILQ